MNDEPGPTRDLSDQPDVDADLESDLEDIQDGCFVPAGCGLIAHAVFVAFIILSLQLDWIARGLAVSLVAAYFIGVWLVRRTIRRMFEVPFAIKGRALEGATAEIHSVTRLEKPPRDSDRYDEGGEEARAWYAIEATITPPTDSAGFQIWEPGELCLIDAAARVERLEDIEGECPLTDVFVEQDGRFVRDEGFKVGGPQTLRFNVALPPNLRRAQFLYYTRTFGDVALPA